MDFNVTMNLVFSFGIAEVVGILTLAATITGIIWAIKAYKHQTEMVEPWSITKVGKDTWLLTRTVPKLATIRGIVNGILCESYEVTWLNFAGFPTGYFKKGTNILIKIDNPPPGAIFEIYYEEHKKENYPFTPAYIASTWMKDYEVPPKSWKKWTTSVY